MDNRNTGKTGRDKSWLTVSDWVTFLSNEKHGISSSFLSFCAVFVALIAIVLSTRNNNWIQSLGTSVFVLALTAWVFCKVFKPLRRRATDARKILNRILSGELIQEEDIRKAWEVGELTNKLEKSVGGLETKVEEPEREMHLVGGRQTTMKVNISTPKFLSIWKSVWKHLPQQISEELADWIDLVKDGAHSHPEEPRYGHYSYASLECTIVLERTISLFIEDLEGLSDPAMAGAMAHELGHAYCHLKSGSPAPCGPEIDTEANLVASAWGFQQELEALDKERKPITDS